MGTFTVYYTYIKQFMPCTATIFDYTQHVLLCCLLQNYQNILYLVAIVHCQRRSKLFLGGMADTAEGRLPPSTKVGMQTIQMSI